MNLYDWSASNRTRAPLARVLACVLLVGVINAVTFGAAHSHLNVSSRFEKNRSASVSGQASPSSVVPVHSHSTKNGCLICVLHQQLFNTVVPGPGLIAKPSILVSFVSEQTVFFYSSQFASSPIARLSGRAPPLKNRADSVVRLVRSLTR